MRLRRAIIVGVFLVALIAIAARSARLRSQKRLAFERREVEAGLDRKITDLSLGGLTAEQAIDAVRQQAGIRIEPEWFSLARAGVTPGTYNIRDVRVHDETVAQILCRILGMYGGYDVRDGVIVLKDNRELPRFARVYDVRDLLPRVASADAWDGMHLVRRTYGDPHAALEGAILGRIHRELGTDWTQDLSARPPTATGCVQYWSGRVVLVQSRRGHEEFRRLIALMRARKRAGLDPLHDPDTPPERITPPLPPLRWPPPTTRPRPIIPLVPDDQLPSAPSTQPSQPSRVIAMLPRSSRHQSSQHA